MATSTDYRFSLYNENGVDLVRENMLYPKLIGTMTLRQKALGELFVVAADGALLNSADATRNHSLNDLRAEGLRRSDYGGGLGVLEQPGEYRTELTHKYQFALYGHGDSLPLLASVIHGWSNARNDTKLEMADLLVSSVISGQDYKFAQLYAQQGGVPPEWRYLTGYDPLIEISRTGLPCTVTFRCRKTGGGEMSGFGQVSVLHGLLYVEMTPDTEIELHFYDLVGIPWDYFQKCSTVRQPEGYGVVGYSYEPPLTQYVIPVPKDPVADPADPTGSYATTNQLGLETGTMVRGRWLFPPGADTTVHGLAQALLQDDLVNKSRLALFLEGDAAAPLRYETFNNARPYLRLLANHGALKKGDQITAVKPSSAHGAVYTVRCGHQYAKVCSMLQHACGGLMQLTGGGLMNAVGGAENFSFWSSHISNRPAAVRPALHIPDDYNGAPWNAEMSQWVAFTSANHGISHFEGGSAPPDKKHTFSDPGVLEKLNQARQGAKSAWFAIRSAVGLPPGRTIKVSNPNYSAEAERARRSQLEHQAQWMNHDRLMQALRTGELDTPVTTVQEIEVSVNETEVKKVFRIVTATRDGEAPPEDLTRHDRIYRMGEVNLQTAQRELEARRSLLEMIESVTDGTEVHHAYQVPFWGMPAFRHSNDRLEVYQPITLLNGNPKAQPPQYVPENWILCRTPV